MPLEQRAHHDAFSHLPELEGLPGLNGWPVEVMLGEELLQGLPPSSRFGHQQDAIVMAVVPGPQTLERLVGATLDGNRRQGGAQGRRRFGATRAQGVTTMRLGRDEKRLRVEKELIGSQQGAGAVMPQKRMPLSGFLNELTRCALDITLGQ